MTNGDYARKLMNQGILHHDGYGGLREIVSVNDEEGVFLSLCVTNDQGEDLPEGEKCLAGPYTLECVKDLELLTEVED